MMKRFNQVFILILIALTVFNACEKDELETVDNKPPVCVKEGVVYFKNREVFKNTVTKLFKDETTSLEAWRKDIGFDNSYQVYCDSLDNGTNEDISELDIMPDPIMRSLLNKDLLFVLNDTIRLYTYENEYVIPIVDWGKVDDIRNAKSCNVEGVDVLPISRQDVAVDSKFTGWQLIKISHVHGNPKLSVHLRAWNVTTGVYASCGVKMTGRKYKKKLRKWKWRNDAMEYARVSGTAYIDEGGFEIPYYGAKAGRKEMVVSKILKQVVSTSGVRFYVNRIDAHFECTHEDGMTAIETWDEVFQ